MRKLLYAFAVTAFLPFVAACQPSVQQEAQAHDAAVKDIAEENKDVEKAAIEGAKDIVKEQREVEDAAAEGTKKIIDEKRELEDAKAREAERAADTPPTTKP
jgi:hypothetical protein